MTPFNVKNKLVYILLFVFSFSYSQMNTHFVTAEPEMDINKARSLMKLHNTARLPVVEDDKLVGMISLFDIILAIFRERGVIQ